MAAPNIFDSTAPHLAGVRGTETAHRKVELQSPADLTFLVAKVTEAARERVERQFPVPAAPEEGGEEGAGASAEEEEDREEVKRRVEELVDEYIRNTFSAAKDGLSINGMDSQELDVELAKIQEGEELEPFNTKLAQKIQSLASQIEAHTLALASLRRKAPQQSAQRFLSTFESSLQSSQTRLEADETARLAEARATRVAVGPPPRRDEVEETFRQGVRGLEEVKGGLAGTVAKMERARMAVEVVGEEGMK